MLLLAIWQLRMIGLLPDLSVLFPFIVDFCPDYLKVPSTIGEWEDQTTTVIHEISHVLGISSPLFSFFRNSVDGTPLTPRGFDRFNFR